MLSQINHKNVSTWLQTEIIPVCTASEYCPEVDSSATSWKVAYALFFSQWEIYDIIFV